ncbi:MAG: transcription-repair coupling factor [Acidobacteria bacterium]|nr:transcription-repair coupling factor [Acidobacteriota bacterium]
MSDALRSTLELIRHEEALRDIKDRMVDGDDRITLAGLSAAASSILIPSLLRGIPSGKLILLAPGEKEAEQFRRDLAFTTRTILGDSARVLSFPSLEADPYQEMEPHLQVACDRVEALRALRGDGQTIVVAPVRALVYPLAPPPRFDASQLELVEGQPLRPDDLSQFLITAGYVRVDLVSTLGEFSRRGGIIDLFPPAEGGPIRVEFWDVEIESLRIFDPETQRSTGRVARAVVPPVREFPWDAEALGRLREALEHRRTERPRTALLDALTGHDDLSEKIEALASGRHFSGFEACVRVVEPDAVSLFDYAADAIVASWEESQILSDLEGVYVEMYASLDLSEDFGMPPPSDLLLDRAALQVCVRSAGLRLSELALEEGEMPSLRRIPCVPARLYRGRLQDLSVDLKGLPEGTTTLFLMESSGHVERLAEVLAEYGLTADVLERESSGGELADLLRGRLQIARGHLSQGFHLPGGKLLVLTEKEVFGEHIEREVKRRKVAAFSPDFRDLKIGDLVVHVEHGIGRYTGLTRVGSGDAQRDFMLLAYEGGDRLYVPTDRLDLVQRYSGMGGPRPRLDRLGGPGWERTKKRVRVAMEEMAKDLIELHAARRAARGIAFSADAPWQREFEDAFPYPLTPDQDKATREVKADMESDVPMDRLICGDVGFGKTEVAMRAAFKAVMDGKQVAVLCPTTVLAFQHLNTFRERFSSWPASIDMLSRFRSPKEQKKILEAVAKGSIDVLIGTHRLLSKDVRFSDLGLLVVDEEQRFGVAHKEAIKAMKKNVDVMTLTATPIPRTLQMSLAGIRDMSVIETPPENRLAIQTAITPFREGMIAAAVRNELKRGGQVYFVHNRVSSIGSMLRLLNKLVPEARVSIAHGQMNEATLERTMVRFLKGEFDILLSTTIIENGLDIPRVNTIIVNRADRFGLAQLYQLRGRVGRSDRRAYAYLMVPPRAALTPIARRRLKVLQEFTELGSGFRIAAMDLEIRGAGNLLGAEQSGNIASVGFDMYCQLLERAVHEVKGEPPPPEHKAQISLGIDIRIPEQAIPDFSERLVLYKKIASVTDEEEIRLIRDRIGDLYGDLPIQAEHLLGLASLRLLADRLHIRSIDVSGGRAQVRFAEESPIDPQRLVTLASERPGIQITPGGLLRAELGEAGRTGDRRRIEAVRELLQALGACASIRREIHPSTMMPSIGDR